MKQQILAQPASEDSKIAACSMQHAAKAKELSRTSMQAITASLGRGCRFVIEKQVLAWD